MLLHTLIRSGGTLTLRSERKRNARHSRRPKAHLNTKFWVGWCYIKVWQIKLSESNNIDLFFVRCQKNEITRHALSQYPIARRFLSYKHNAITCSKPLSLERAPPRQCLDDLGFLQITMAYDQILCNCFLWKRQCTPTFL
jgi:hypothetical protein